MVLQITHNSPTGWKTHECTVIDRSILSERSYTNADVVEDAVDIMFICCTISPGFPNTCTLRSEVLKGYLKHRPAIQAWFEEHAGMPVDEFCARRYNGGVAA